VTYQERNNDYYRIDVRISFKMNRPKTGHLFALDVQNVTTEESFPGEYNPDSGRLNRPIRSGYYLLFVENVFLK